MAAPPSYSQATDPGYDPKRGYGGGTTYNTQYAQGGAYVNASGQTAYHPTSQAPLLDGGSLENDGPFAGDSFSDKAVRRTFIRKVYMILTVQLLFTVGVIALFLFVDSLKGYVQGSGFWLYYIAYATFLVTYIVLVCCPDVRRKWPGNFICLAVFTAAFSFMMGTISSYHNVESVLIAAGITALVCVGVTIFATQTKIDFTMCSGLLFGLMLVLLLFGISLAFVFALAPIDARTYYILRCVYGALGALVFTLFLIFDTQMLFGKHKHKLSPEEHIFGALQLYLDVVYIFIFILGIFGGKS